MNTKQKVDTLWREMREAINKTYADASKKSSSGDPSTDANCLRDYAENISWSDDLAGLLGRETANERQHRSNRPSVPGFSNETAAKLILMEQVKRGAENPTLPSATEFLVFRKTAVEARVIGFLIREHLTPEWRERVSSLDYAKLMKAEVSA
jgi:hypothetical protein